jgi:death-on-curing family protein
MIKTISIEAIEYSAYELAKKTMGWNEPIPAFNTRYPNVLESCVITPFQKFDKKFLYKGLVEKAAILFYCMIKNHPFQNGNKRIAVTTLFIFLYLNKKWLKVDNKELYIFAVWVAESNPKLKDAVVSGVIKFIEMYMFEIYVVDAPLQESTSLQ